MLSVLDGQKCHIHLTNVQLQGKIQQGTKLIFSLMLCLYKDDFAAISNKCYFPQTTQPLGFSSYLDVEALAQIHPLPFNRQRETSIDSDEIFDNITHSSMSL